MMNWAKFLMIPYKKHGTDFKGADCYGFANLILREVYNDYRFPDYLGGDNLSEEVKLANKTPEIATECGIEKICLPIDGCFVRMVGEGFGTHCGVYIGDNKVIHISKTKGAVIEDKKYLEILDYWK